MLDLLERNYYGNSVGHWALACTIAVALTLMLLFTHRVVAGRLLAYAQSTTNHFDNLLAEIVNDTKSLFLIILAFYIGTQFIELPDKVDRIVNNFAITALLLQAALWLNHAASYWLNYYLEKKKRRDTASIATIALLGFIFRIAIWVLVLLMILENLGFNVTTLVASLGIGGVAIALAVQNILGDIFASLSIALDKPFVIGDFIIVGDAMGTVEHIGLKTTRLISLSGEQIVFSNTDLLKNRIHNYKRMIERRVQFNLKVRYENPREKLATISTIIRKIIESKQKTRFDRAHFKEYGDWALNFEVVYFVQDPDYNLYMDIQQAINLDILEAFQRDGIELASSIYFRPLPVFSPKT